MSARRDERLVDRAGHFFHAGVLIWQDHIPADVLMSFYFTMSSAGFTLRVRVPVDLPNMEV